MRNFVSVHTTKIPVDRESQCGGTGTLPQGQCGRREKWETRTFPFFHCARILRNRVKCPTILVEGKWHMGEGRGVWGKAVYIRQGKAGEGEGEGEGYTIKQ